MSRLLLTAPLALAFTAQLAGAQQPARELYLVGQYNVPVGHAPHFENSVAKLTEAAKAARVGNGQDWVTWQNGVEYTIAFRLDNMAELDQANRMAKAFAGTATEGAYTAAVSEFNRIPFAQRTEVVERISDPALRYEPENAPKSTHMRVNHYWVQPGKERDFEALAKDVIAVYREIGYPYRTTIFRTIVGEGRRYTVTVYHDGLSDFHGANSLGKLIRDKKAQRKWDALVARYREIVERAESVDAIRNDRMTYVTVPSS